MADWYQLTKSKDGAERLTLKVEHRLSLEDIAIILAGYSADDVGDHDPKQFAIEVWKSRGDVMAEVKKALEERTLEGWCYYGGDNNLETVVEGFLERLELLW